MIVAGGWAVLVEPRFILDEQERFAPVPALPAAWRGAQVAVISDLQVGMWFGNVGMARDAVGEIIERDPDVALVLGDFVYGHENTKANVATAVDVVAPLAEAGIATFAVLGNHDHASGAVVELSRLLPAAGIRVLQNDSVALERDGATLHVVGIGSHIAGRSKPDRALAGVPERAARVVAMHNPASFADLPDGAAPLAVAGHTHGGQLRIPFLPEWSYLSLLEEGPVHVDGWIDGYGEPGNRLFVNRGIGMSRLPARLNCSPAITIFTLVDAA